MTGPPHGLTEERTTIGIVGAGAIGGWIGAKLAGQGHAVSVYARGATLEAVRAHGLRLARALGAAHLVSPYSRIRAYSPAPGSASGAHRPLELAEQRQSPVQ